MLMFSFLFLCSSLFLTQLFGSVGFILANCVNMAGRIIHRYAASLHPSLHLPPFSFTLQLLLHPLILLLHTTLCYSHCLPLTLHDGSILSVFLHHLSL